jgi:hypothetical protein
MIKFSNRMIFHLFFATNSMFLASCHQQPMYIMEPETQQIVQKIEVKTLHPPSEEILTCLASSLDIPAEQLEGEFRKEKEEFIAESSNERRHRLICLSLARLDKPDSLGYAKELMNDMLLTETVQSPDIKGLAALLNYFQQLQEKRIAEVNKAQRQVNELKKKLEDLKSIDKIMKERKDGN